MASFFAPFSKMECFHRSVGACGHNSSLIQFMFVSWRVAARTKRFLFLSACPEAYLATPRHECDSVSFCEKFFFFYRGHSIWSAEHATIIVMKRALGNHRYHTHSWSCAERKWIWVWPTGGPECYTCLIFVGGRLGGGYSVGWRSCANLQSGGSGQLTELQSSRDWSVQPLTNVKSKQQLFCFSIWVIENWPLQFGTHHSGFAWND